MALQDDVTNAFRARYGTEPMVVRAPGRVNLIGEHTDYNDGFVLPMTIDRASWIAFRPRPGREVEVHSLDFNETSLWSLDDLVRTESGPHENEWAEYLKGVAWALSEAGYALQGWEGVMAGDVPIGAGLSSSAALELATARAFAVVSGFDWDPAQMALLGQRAENGWVGVNSGIMDQMISAAGQAGHALLIDCRSLDYQNVPLPSGAAVVVLDTATRRGLVGSAYNERREQCEAAARAFGVPALRDVSVAEFEAKADQLDPVTRKRARHVVTENARTLEAAEAMRRDDGERLGVLMRGSHQSLRDDFEVSSSALDTIVALADTHPACLGARMTGAGFGGCAVALVRADAAQDFADEVGRRYAQETGKEPALYVCSPTDGAAVISLGD